MMGNRADARQLRSYDCIASGATAVAQGCDVSHEDYSQSDFDAVVLSLNEGVFEQPYWANFLIRIRAFVDADYASLTFRRADARLKDINVIKSSFSDFSIGREDVNDVVQRLGLPYQSIQANRPYSINEILDKNDPDNVEYVNYLNQRRVDHAFVMRVAEVDGGSCWLTLGRPQSDFADWVRGALTRLAPHLGIAARTLARLEREHLRGEIAGDAVRRLDFGWMTLDACGRVIEIDPGAARLFGTAASLEQCSRSEPLPLTRGARNTLTEILAGFADKRSVGPQAVHLVDDPWIDMLLLPVGYRAVSGGLTPVAVGFVHGPGAASADRCEQLMALFNLTMNEARLGLALSHGKTIAEAADELNLTIGTTRNYSKRVYAKTGTRGQADLVRIILASVIAMA